MFRNIYPREKYLSRLRPFYHSDIVKVITGIRRCGKSCILKSVINELLEQGIRENQIIYIPLDKRGYKNIKTPEQLEEKIESQINNEDKYYLFVDEVQNVTGFESVIQAYEEEGYSIFLTGSNSYLLSDEISTKLTGRYLNFETCILSPCHLRRWTSGFTGTGYARCSAQSGGSIYEKVRTLSSCGLERSYRTMKSLNFFRWRLV